jgi:hypothetical protein
VSVSSFIDLGTIKEQTERSANVRKINVALYGVGAVGSMIAKCLLEKKGVEVVSAIDIAHDKVGKDLGDVLKLGKKVGVIVSNDVNADLARTRPEVAIHTTSSYLRDVYPQIDSLVKNHVNVISTCEELSYPSATEPKLAKAIDTLAKEQDVTVLGTGINPGFLMDTLVITLTAPCQRIEKIEVTRVMNAASRRLPFQKKIGAGLTLEEFRRRIDEEQITGHVGLEQSIAMISAALAWKLDGIVVEPVEPVVAGKGVKSKDIEVKRGNAAGLRQKAKGMMKKREVIVLDFQAYIGAEDEHDAIRITGLPPINQEIRPCVHGDAGTVAMIVNMIPKVINAHAGLLTMKDLPVPSAAVEDMAEYVIG